MEEAGQAPGSKKSSPHERTSRPASTQARRRREGGGEGVCDGCTLW